MTFLHLLYYNDYCAKNRQIHYSSVGEGKMDRILKIIDGKHKLKELGSQGFSGLKVKGMTFTMNSYEAEGLGYVSTMVAKGFFGLLRMDTLIINPTVLDLPLFSYDRIHAFGKDKAMIEFYDTMVEKTSLEKLHPIKDKNMKYVFVEEAKPAWYDDVRLPETVSYQGKKADTPAIDAICLEYYKTFFEIDAPAVTDHDAKAQKIDYYVDGLLNNGGPATDVFVQKFGKEKTSDLFKKVLFLRG